MESGRCNNSFLVSPAQAPPVERWPEEYAAEMATAQAM